MTNVEIPNQDDCKVLIHPKKQGFEPQRNNATTKKPRRSRGSVVVPF